MYYTVIAKSGWQGDFWRVRMTFAKKSLAQNYATVIMSNDPKQEGYKIDVKGHRKPKRDLWHQDGYYQFSDGTKAW